MEQPTAIADTPSATHAGSAVEANHVVPDAEPVEELLVEELLVEEISIDGMCGVY
jgi:mycofactocin precursor